MLTDLSTRRGLAAIGYTLLLLSALVAVLACSGCVTWDSFIVHERATCKAKQNAVGKGWQIECYGRNCKCYPVEP